MENNNAIFKAIITANNEEIFAHEVARKLIDVIADMAINYPSKIMAIQFKDLDPWFIDEYLHKFEHIDGQYVFEGKFICKEDLEKKLERTMDLGDDTTLSIANRISKANPKEVVRDIFNLRIQIKAVKEDLNEMRQAYAEYFPEGEKVEVPQE